MRDYGKVSPQFWTGPTGKDLKAAGPEAMIVGLYLMTSPHANMIGLYYLPIMYIAHETGLGAELAERGLRAAVDAGFCAYDDDAEIVFVPRMAAYQVAETLSVKDNRRIAVIRELEACSHVEFSDLFRQVYAVPFNLDAPKYPSVPNHRFSPSLVARVVRACGGVCKGCGTPFTDDIKPTIDHVVAKINGGGRDEDNLQALCRSCNSRKAAKDRDLFWERTGIAVTPYEGVDKGSEEEQAPLRSQEQEQEQEQERKPLSGKPDPAPTDPDSPEGLIGYLNAKAGKRFRPVEANARLVRARLAEATADEIRRVIDARCAKWRGDPKMAEYLRPSTLFGREKFAQYLGEIDAPSATKDVKWWVQRGYGDEAMARRDGHVPPWEEAA